MSESGRPSIETEALSAARLANSARVREALRWLLAVVTMIGGWAAAKLDTKMQVDAMSGKVDVLSGEIAVLTSQQRDLVNKIDRLTSGPGENGEPPGQIYQLRNEVRYAHRNAVRAWAAAVTHAKGAKAKQDAGKPLVNAFNDLTGDGKSPSDAADIVISTVAVQ